MLLAASRFHLSYFSFGGFLLPVIRRRIQGTGCGSTGIYQIKLISLNMGSSGLHRTIRQRPEHVNCHPVYCITHCSQWMPRQPKHNTEASRNAGANFICHYRADGAPQLHGDCHLSGITTVKLYPPYIPTVDCGAGLHISAEAYAKHYELAIS